MSEHRPGAHGDGLPEKPGPAVSRPEPPHTQQFTREELRLRTLAGTDSQLGFECDASLAAESDCAAKEGARPDDQDQVTPDLTGCPPPPPSTAPMGPRTREFGPYQILGEIGRGGMGVVYRARDQKLSRPVALKMILASHLASPEQVQRFYAEARAAAQLRSPHVVGIHEVGQIHGQHYIAMDLVDGPSLAERVRSGPMDPREACRHVATVARAMADLHARGVVHRDLKPSNVLLDATGSPCVTDFGLAKMLQAEGRMTRSGMIVGTPGYMAPEQAAGRDADVGPRSDVYSLGAILYELITGRPPFAGQSPLETLVQVLEGEPPRPRSLRPELPRPLERICLKCLERRREDRYQSASELADDIDRFLRGEPVEAGRGGPWTYVRRWARREPALVSRLGTMLLCGSIIHVHDQLIRPLPKPAYRQSLEVVVLWACVSIVAQSLLNRGRFYDLARYIWAAADVVFFTLLVLINNGLHSSLVAGYFLLVIASGLWFRERLVGFTTALSVLGFGLLVQFAWGGPTTEDTWFYQYVVFVAALIVSGLITGSQVRRVRALSQYYEHRPVP